MWATCKWRRQLLRCPALGLSGTLVVSFCATCPIFALPNFLLTLLLSVSLLVSPPLRQHILRLSTTNYQLYPCPSKVGQKLACEWAVGLCSHPNGDSKVTEAAVPICVRSSKLTWANSGRMTSISGCDISYTVPLGRLLDLGFDL